MTTAQRPALLKNQTLAGLLVPVLALALAACGGGGGAASSPAITPEPIANPPVQAPELPAATGPTYYFSDCQTGASAGCVPGDNAHAGTTAAVPKRTLAGIDVNALPAGSRLLFARGGVWTAFSLQLHNLHVTPTQPLVFDAYTPTWGGMAAPWLKVGGMSVVFQFGAFGETNNDGGYTVRNLKLDGLGQANAWGVHVRNDARNVTLESLEITGFEIGVHSQNSGPLGNTALVIRNSNIHHNSDMGMLGDAIDMVIEGNTIANNNFSGSGFSHGIYLGGHGLNGTVRNNTFSHNSTVNGVCTGGNFTVHGQWNGLVVEGNTVVQAASEGGCYGISINPGYSAGHPHADEYFRNLVVRGNTVVNVGGCGICLTSAPGVLIENNLIVNTQPTYMAAILISNALNSADDPDGQATIRNNTVHMTQAGSGSEGVALRAGSGNGLRVVSNLIHYGAASSPYTRCFADTVPANYIAFDNNLCHHASGNGGWSSTYASLALARLAGLDAHGLSGDPLFVALPTAASPGTDALQAGSPARNAGHATLSSAADRLGAARSAPDIGAREQPARP